jgi:hypothetical protein
MISSQLMISWLARTNLWSLGVIASGAYEVLFSERSAKQSARSQQLRSKELIKLFISKCKNSPSADCFANNDRVPIDDFRGSQWTNPWSLGVIARGAYEVLFSETFAKQSARSQQLLA